MYNIVRDNQGGIQIVNGDELGLSMYNTISHNLIYDNQGYGVRLLTLTENNSVLCNSFKDNKLGGSQANDDGTDNDFMNNHWADWMGVGSYPIDGLTGNHDPSPLTNPYHLSAPVITSPTSGTLTLTDNVTIQWTASTDTYAHSMTYSVYYSTDDGTTWIEVVSGLNTTNYTWDLTNIADETIVLIKVQTTDSVGFNSFSVTTSTFIIENPLLISTSTPSWNVLLLLLSLFIMLLLRPRKKKT